MLFTRGFFCFSILYAIYHSDVCQSLSTVTSSKVLGLQQRMKLLTADGGMIFLDGDNVRGKTKFQLSKEGSLCHSKLLLYVTQSRSNDMHTTY
jgi:hypothetical protein